MFDSKKFSKLQQNTQLYEGMVIKGYTYNIGDFRTVNDKWIGWPKLRLGVIVNKFSQNYVKVQFRNSAARKKENQKVTNQINVFDKKNKKLINSVLGTDSYCMWLRRDSIETYYRPITTAIFCYKSIYQKHSKRKKDVEKKYFKNQKISGLKPSLIKKILHEWQFSKEELVLSPELANLKIDVLIKKHNNSNDFCIPKEYKKIVKAKKFFKPSFNNTDLNLEIELKNYLKYFDDKKCKIK